MHHNMAEFVCQTEPLAIRRHIPVQEDAWRHVWYLNGKTIHLEGGKVTMDDDASCSLHPRHQIADRSRWYEPRSPY